MGRAIRAWRVVDVYAPEARSTLARRALSESAAEPRSRRFAAALQRRVLETYSTPFLYACFGTLSTGDYERDYQAYVALSLASSVLSIVALARILRLPWTTSDHYRTSKGLRSGMTMNGAVCVPAAVP